MVYVVGNEQNYHFQVLSLLLDKLGFEFGKGLVHFSYGMVELPEGKMKSREGTVVDADDLLEEMIRTAREMSNELGKLEGYSKEEIAEVSRIVGLGALKYFILKVDPRKNMVFNPRESIDFNGNTGPFIQYAYARIQSLLRKAMRENADAISGDLNCNIAINEKEEALIQQLSGFPEIVMEAATDFNPAVIANYLYDLVKEYNQFYHDYSILKEEKPDLKKFRLILSANVGKIIKIGFSLLGIEVPERM
jgi:arginyl-tRNA synthetase